MRWMPVVFLVGSRLGSDGRNVFARLKCPCEGISLAPRTQLVAAGADAGETMVSQFRRHIVPHRNSEFRFAFTLVELLVVIAILATLLGFFLPSIQAARESGRRMACAANLRQVALAGQLFHDTRRALPEGARSWGFGTWATKLLPFLEEGQAASRYRSGDPYFDAVNRPVTERRFGIYSCPSDGREYSTLDAWAGARRADGLPKHNYVANFGNTGFYPSGFGEQPPVASYGSDTSVRFGGAPFNWAGEGDQVKGVRFGEISDGLSKTIMFSETIQGRSGGGDDDDFRGILWHSEMCWFSGYLSPNSSEPDISHSWFCHNPGNPACLEGFHSEARPATMAARSRHPGGVIIALCDGSARFNEDDIAVSVWRALTTTRGNEP
jgi:prepilin-type N-terminal cleavage/methylation domain-containing protein